MADNRYLLQSEIHQQTNTGMLATGYHSLIASLLDQNDEDDVNFIKNHIGREWFKKLSIYGLESYITDPYDAGFRPLTVTGVLAAGSSSSPSSVSQIENVFGEYVFAPTASQELYFDLGATISTTI